MLSIPEKEVFGVDAQVHRITGMPLQQGAGALDPDEQAIGHMGLLEYDLAALTQKRKDHSAKLADETGKRNLMLANHNAIAANDIAARQSSVYSLAQQDAVVAAAERQSAALSAAHEELAVRIAEIRTRLSEEDILSKFGERAAGAWRGKIRERGWTS
jgi:hypothetical protein